jgi:hypothetical protein
MNLLVNYLFSSEMVKKQLPPDKQDKVNQYSVIGALMPFPMGAVMASVMAKNEASGPSTTTPPPLLSTTPVDRSPVKVYVGDQLISGEQPIPFGKRLKGEGGGKARLTVTLKNPSGPTVKLSTDISGPRFSMPKKRGDETFRQGDVFEAVVAFDTTTTTAAPEEGRFFVVVNGVERSVLLTGEVVHKPEADIKLDRQPWTHNSPQYVEFAASGDRRTHQIVIANTGLIDLTLWLLQGCDPVGYKFADPGGVDLKEQLQKGLRIATRATTTVTLDGAAAGAGVTSLILTTDNQSPRFDDLLVALLDKKSD